MKSLKPALIVLSFGLCLLIFFLTSSLDLALTTSVSVYLLFFYKNYLPIFIISIVLFLLNILFDYYDLNLRFISDLSIDAYILLILAVSLYFRAKNDFLDRFLKIDTHETRLLYKEVTPKIVISIILAGFFFPIVGGPLASLIGYIFFSVFIKKNDGKIAVLLAVFILFLTSIFLLFRNQAVGKELGIYAYYFLVAGTLQEVINLVRKRHEEKPKETKVEEKSEIEADIITSQGAIALQLSNKKISSMIFGSLAFVISFAIFYFLLQRFPIVSPANLSLTPTVTISPIIFPQTSLTPTISVPQVSTQSAKLKILVQNGTEISGLAASSAAKLKKAGFNDVKIGNSDRKDYKNWELISAEKDTSLPSLFKYILELSDMTLKEASAPSGVDVLIIAGSSK